VATADLSYLVKRDTREQLGWEFPEKDRCRGTVAATLKTGDYTLEGFEDRFVIERKRSPSELSQNLFQKRFDAELVRLDKFEHAYLFLEFEFADLVRFPENSGVPKSKWPFLRVTPQLLVKRLHEVQLEHPSLRVLFVGRYGREAASSLFKRVVDNG
jgi:hypothetical protein